MKGLTKVMAVALAAVLVGGVYVAPAKAAESMDKGVKAQIGASVNADSETSSIRLLSGVDSLDYSEVGFYVTINGNEEKVSTTTVYESVKAAGEVVAAGDVIEGASYVAAVSVTNITEFEDAIYVKPYWVDANGNETVEVQLEAERANVAKQTFVTEEVNVGKTTQSHTETIVETIQREELNIDRDGNVVDANGSLYENDSITAEDVRRARGM